jgi:hypothetical protein
VLFDRAGGGCRQAWRRLRTSRGTAPLKEEPESGFGPGQAGFSLLEVVVALVILMTLLVSVSSLLVTSFKAGANSRFRQAATEIATSNLDAEVQLGSATLVAKVGDSALATVTSAGQQYLSEMEVSPYTPGSAACANPNGGLAMLKITVWVTWADVASGSSWWVSGSASSTGNLVEETTLLALPSTAFNTNDGSILVDISGASGSSDGIQGVTVTITSGSTNYTAVTTASGCALFANLTPGTWTVGATKSGYIDDLDDWNSTTNVATPLTYAGGASVVADLVASVNFTYDQEATVTPSYSAPDTGGLDTPNPTGISGVPLTFYTTYGTAFPATGVVLPSPSSVFPSNTSPSYYVVAGSCGIESAPDGNNITGAATDGQAITVTPGSQATPAFALTPVELVVTHAGAPVANASVTATSTDSNCSSTYPMPTLGLGNTCNPSGPTFPCTYQLSAYRHSSRRHRAHAILVNTCNSNCTTSTTVTSNMASPSPYGALVTFTATVTCSGGSTCSPPTAGTVTFKIGNTTEPNVTVNASGVAIYTTTSAQLPVGSTTIKGTYNGSGKWNANGGGTITQTVNAAPTTTSLVWSPIPTSYGNSVLLTATVSANSPSVAVPTGTVTFQNGGVNIAGCVNVAVNGFGVATCTVSGLGAASYTMKATYTPSSGPTNFVTSNSSLTQSITAASTTTTLTSSSPSNTSTYGASVTFTATMASSTGVATAGTVNFTSGGTTITGCGAVAVTSGVATCTTTSLAVGTQTIGAAYTSSNTTNVSSSSGSLTQQVNLGATTPYLLSSLPVGVWVLKITYGAATTTFNLTITPGEGAILLQEAD